MITRKFDNGYASAVAVDPINTIYGKGDTPREAEHNAQYNLNLMLSEVLAAYDIKEMPHEELVALASFLQAKLNGIHEVLEQKKNNS